MNMRKRSFRIRGYYNIAILKNRRLAETKSSHLQINKLFST